MLKLKVFLDSNIFLAGLASSKGASAEILRLAEVKAYNILTSKLVLKESERNFKKKLAEFLSLFYFALKHLEVKIFQDSRLRIQDKKLVSLLSKESDRIIFRTAGSLKPDYFVTLNRKHFHQAKIKQIAQFKIVTPAQFLAEWRNIYSTLE